ncbi:hypothetical protein Tco_0675751 [Tanacetum coccineum]
MNLTHLLSLSENPECLNFRAAVEKFTRHIHSKYDESRKTILYGILAVVALIEVRTMCAWQLAVGGRSIVRPKESWNPVPNRSFHRKTRNDDDNIVNGSYLKSPFELSSHYYICRSISFSMGTGPVIREDHFAHMVIVILKA